MHVGKLLFFFKFNTVGIVVDLLQTLDDFLELDSYIIKIIPHVMVKNISILITQTKCLPRPCDGQDGTCDLQFASSM